jgi:hypothetical protein
VVERDISREVDWTVRDDCMVSSVAGSISDGHFFVRGHPKEHVYAVPPTPKFVEVLVARLQAAVTIADRNKLRNMRKDVVWCTAVCLDMDGGCFDRIL